MTVSAPVSDIAILLLQTEMRDDHIALEWSDGSVTRFHHLWLRDNCRCEKCLHPQTWERIIDSMALDPEIKPVAMDMPQADLLTLTWADGHVSEFNAGWLHRRAYDRPARPEYEEIFWGSEILADLPQVDAAEIDAGDEGLARWIEQIRDYGLSVVRNVAGKDREVERLAGKIAFLRETNFGVGFDVESKPDPNNVAYTALELKAHTDLPNREMPPGIQFLHCMEASAEGGESVLVDGFAAAQALRERDPAAFEVLTRVQVPFQFQDREWDLRWTSPVISLDASGRLREIRYHAALTAPVNMAFDDVPAYYRAIQSFTRILRDPAFEIRLRMEAGDMICFHNRRVLHGRAAFDPQSGKRKLQGCYVDCDDAWSKLRVLNREADWDVRKHG